MSNLVVFGKKEAINKVDTGIKEQSEQERLETKVDEFAHSVDKTRARTREELPPEKVSVAKTENRLTAEAKKNIVEKAAAGVRFWYIDGEKANAMASRIETNLREGAYASHSDPSSLKESLVADLKGVYRDEHIFITEREEAIPEIDSDRVLKDLDRTDMTPEQRKILEDEDALEARELTENPNWISRSEILPGSSTGYFKFDLFPPDLEAARKRIDETMQKISGADELIIDLRDNRGGNPHTVARVASYLFDERTLLNHLDQRSNGKRESTYADPTGLESTFGGKKPIYVLVSNKTFSAAEELAYDLQSAGRAVVIGQKTGGGAHPIKNYVLDDHLYISIPYKRAVNPHTLTNWEGIGVIPDYPTDGDALKTAQELIAREKSKSCCTIL